MPFKNKEKKKQYDRERLRRIREKEIENQIEKGNLNFGLGVKVKEEEKPKPKEAEHFSVRESPFSTDVRSLSDESQGPSEPEGEGLGTNPWHQEELKQKRKQKSNQDRLKDEFGKYSE